MTKMTSYERFKNTLEKKPVDHCPVMASPWEATWKKWTEQGHLEEGEDLVDHFDMDMRSGGWLNLTADLEFKPVTLEETEETILQLDGNGAKLRRHKQHDSTPEHVDFTVKDRSAWEDIIKPHLQEADRRRIDIEQYRENKEKAAQKQRFFCWAGLAPFECMHPVCGHEYMLMGMALDPEWIKDMVMTYCRLIIKLQETLFAEQGRPDGIFYYEDMGFKHKPFMSPKMYKEIIQPGHELLFDYAHSLGCKVIVHSCGYVEPLVPGLIEAGMNCLQAMEVKAGMDLPHLFDRFGDKISFYGGFDVRTLEANDYKLIDREMEKVSYVTGKGGSYILHSDHSESPAVEYETIRYFINRGRELTTAK